MRPLGTHARSLVLVGLLLLFVAFLDAAPSAATAVSMEKVGEGDDPVAVLLVAAPVTGPAAAEAPQRLELEVEAPWQGEIDLDPRFSWQLSAEAEGFWAADRVVAAGEQRAPTLRLWPTAELKGRLVSPEDGEPPTEISARFLPTPLAQQKSEVELPAGTVSCPVEERWFFCTLPAGGVDLRLRAAGYVSHYYWGNELEPGELVDLGELVLRHGASLTGIVTLEDGELDPERCVVTLEPFVAARPRSVESFERLDRLGHRQMVSDRGFFHFQGVEPGRYVVTAHQPGWAEARQSQVPVIENAETELREPLVLRRPLTLEVQVEPSVDPASEAWTVIVEQQQGDGELQARYETIGQGRASREGVFELPGLSPGSYGIRVTDSLGARVAWEEVDLAEESPPIRIRLQVTAVEGDVKLGDEPLAARLVFGGRRGETRVEMASDADGEFSGRLPDGGRWPVFVEAESPRVRRTVEVEVPDGDAEEEVSYVEIRLPDTRIGGETVDEQGMALPKAVVKLVDPATREVGWAQSDEEGQFRFSGVVEGTVFVDAEWHEGRPSRSASPQAVPIVEGRHVDDLRLVLRPVSEVSGQVVAEGQPLPGVAVQVVPKRFGREYPFSRVPRSATDVSGHFRVQVPADADTLEITVLPPGHTLTLLTLFEVPEELVIIPVEEAGGTLAIEAGGGAALTGRTESTVVVLHQGRVLSLSGLGQWAVMNGIPSAEPSRLVVPQMPPGDYAACWLALEEYSRTLSPDSASGGVESLLRARAEAGRCASGHLNAFGDLRLQLPAPPEAPESLPALPGEPASGLR